MKVRTVYPEKQILNYFEWIAWIKLNHKWTKRNNKYKNQVG